MEARLKTMEENKLATETKDETPAGTTDESKTESTESTKVANGTVKALVNGESSDDTTAVNTPDRSATPLEIEKTEPSEPTTSSTMETEIPSDPEVFRLQMLHLQKLINFLKKEFEPVRNKVNDLLSSGDIQFSLLWCLFRLGSVISFKDHESGLVMAGEVPHYHP